jgi:hypothetical protein
VGVNTYGVGVNFAGPLWLPESETDQGAGDRIQTIQDNSSGARLDVVSGTCGAVTSAELPRAGPQKGGGEVIQGGGQNLRTGAKETASMPDEEVRPRRTPPLKTVNKLVKYPVIGRNNVAVPTHLYKVRPSLSCLGRKNILIRLETFLTMN